MARLAWDREQLIEVLKLYCRTPFGRLHSRNPDIVDLADRIGRTPGAVALKAVNFASLDPTIERKGMANASALDRQVWEEFFSNIDRFLDQSEDQDPPIGFDEAAQSEYIAALPEGMDRQGIARIRLNQRFFRDMVLASYDRRCAISGIDNPELLNASHIVPWSVDPSARTNPRNGICLNVLHDRAFDRGLIAFAEDHRVILSPQLPDQVQSKMMALGNDRLNLPNRFLPDPRYLAYHRKNIFRSK